MILLLIGHCPGLRSKAPALIISAIRGGVSLAGSPSGSTISASTISSGSPGIWAVEHSILDGWLRRVLLPVARVAERLFEEPHDRVLRRRDDLVDLRRDQTCAVEEILGDLRADPERHLGVLHHPDQHLGRLVGIHDQPLGSAATALGAQRHRADRRPQRRPRPPACIWLPLGRVALHLMIVGGSSGHLASLWLRRLPAMISV